MPPPAPEPGAVAKLLAVARPVAFLKGALLVRQGEPSRGAFLLGAGEAEARVALPGGGAQAVARFGPGEMFGEMALVERGICSASVVALSHVYGWFVARDDFRALVAGRDPQALALQRALVGAFIGRLRALNARVAEFPSSEERPVREPAPVGDPLAGVPRLRRGPFDWRAFLPRLAFFEGFDAADTDEVVSIGQVLELGRGAWVFAAGAPAQAAFLVLRGAVEIFARAGSRERRIAIAGPGEPIGHVALLAGEAHAADARVREGALLLEFPRAPFLALCEGDSGAAASLRHALQRALLRALARTNGQLVRRIAHARLARAGAEAEALEQALAAQVVRAQA